MPKNKKGALTPKPARQELSPPEVTSAERSKEFLERIARNAPWYCDKTGRKVAAVWIDELTSEIAREWLDHVDESHQRTITENVVRRYTADICAGNFIPAIPMLIFDRRARLINGQHILQALVHSGAESLAVTVQVNLNENAYQAPDQNKKRSVRDTLKWVGVERPGDVSGVLTVLFQYLKGYYADKGYLGARQSDKLPTNAEAEALQKRFPEISSHLWKNPSAGGGFSLPAFRASSLILHQIDKARARVFFESLVEGLGFSGKDDPRYVLHIALIRAHVNAGDRGGWRHGETMLRIFKAWNAWVVEGSISGPLYRKGELFQNPLELMPVPDSPRSSPRAH